MILAPNNILKDMRKHKPMKYKPIKQSRIEKAKKQKTDLTLKNKNLFV